MRAEFVNAASFTAELGRQSQGFDTGLKQAVRIVEKDHTQLANRDRPDQHPIGAITNLEASLGAKLSAGDALTNLEIESLLGGI